MATECIHVVLFDSRCSACSVTPDKAAKAIVSRDGDVVCLDTEHPHYPRMQIPVASPAVRRTKSPPAHGPGTDTDACGEGRHVCLGTADGCCNDGEACCGKDSLDDPSGFVSACCAEGQTCVNGECVDDTETGTDTGTDTGTGTGTGCSSDNQCLYYPATITCGEETTIVYFPATEEGLQQAIAYINSLTECSGSSVDTGYGKCCNGTCMTPDEYATNCTDCDCDASNCEVCIMGTCVSDCPETCANGQCPGNEPTP